MNLKFIMLIFILSACLKNDPLPPKPILENPASISIFCQAQPSTEIDKKIFEYSDNKLIKKTEYVYSASPKTTTYTYNSEDQLIQEMSLHYNTGLIINFIYNADNLLVEREYLTIDSYGTSNADTSRFTEQLTYNGVYLIKETQYWGGFISYEYEGGLLSLLTSHNAQGQPHHSTKYEYKGGRLSSETKITQTGNPIYYKEYLYDAEGKLREIIEDGKTVELNKYDGLKLTEKTINYYGIDPCFSACCNQFIYRYKY